MAVWGTLWVARCSRKTLLKGEILKERTQKSYKKRLKRKRRKERKREYVCLCSPFVAVTIFGHLSLMGQWCESCEATELYGAAIDLWELYINCDQTTVNNRFMQDLDCICNMWNKEDITNYSLLRLKVALYWRLQESCTWAYVCVCLTIQQAFIFLHKRMTIQTLGGGVGTTI